jgi:hypothetical protein
LRIYLDVQRGLLYSSDFHPESFRCHAERMWAEHDRESAAYSGYNRRGSKDSQLR